MLIVCNETRAAPTRQGHPWYLVCSAYISQHKPIVKFAGDEYIRDIQTPKGEMAFEFIYNTSRGDFVLYGTEGGLRELEPVTYLSKGTYGDVYLYRYGMNQVAVKKVMSIGKLRNFVKSGNQLALENDITIATLLRRCMRPDLLLAQTINVTTAFLRDVRSGLLAQMAQSADGNWHLGGGAQYMSGNSDVQVTLYQVMELCTGDAADSLSWNSPLQKYRRETAFDTRTSDIQDLCRTLKDIADCTSIMLGDVKPANLLLCMKMSSTGNRIRPVLGDMGSFFQVGSMAYSTFYTPWHLEGRGSAASPDDGTRVLVDTTRDACKLGVFCMYVLMDALLTRRYAKRRMDVMLPARNMLETFYFKDEYTASKTVDSNTSKAPIERYKMGLDFGLRAAEAIMAQMRAEKDPDEDEQDGTQSESEEASDEEYDVDMIEYY